MGKLGGGLGRGSSPEDAREGACFAAAAIAIDPASPLGYALLARCEWRCGDACAAAAAAMGAATHPGADAVVYTSGHEHAWLLLDAAKVGMEAASAAAEEGGGDREGRAAAVEEMRDRFTQEFPGLRPELAEMGDGSCTVQ